MIAAVARIDLGALRANYALARERAGGRAVIAVVKADAYGHGAVPVARCLRAAGCGSLAVWSVDEALALRDDGDAGALLVLRGLSDAEEAREAAQHGLVPVLHDPGGLERAAAAARASRRPLAVQVEVDTGMRRMGIPAEGAAEFIARVARTPGLELAGVFTHLARADEAELAPSLEQLEAFASVLGALRERGVDPGAVHVANSAGLARIADWEAQAPPQQAVRPGLWLYGAQPARGAALPLQPVMSLQAPVVAVRRVRRGDPVGYGAEYRAPADTRIATLGIGYADGVPVSASGTGGVWLAGARRPLAGRVSMDYVGVDVGDAPVSVGDPAVLFGSERPGGPAVLPVDEAAAAAGTLSYELLVRVGARVIHILDGV